MKMKNAAEVGIAAQHVKLPRTTTHRQLLDELERLNNDDAVHGIILQVGAFDMTPFTQIGPGKKATETRDCYQVGRKLAIPDSMLLSHLQLPPESDEPIDSLEATNAIAAAKDVDGLTDENAGKLSRGLVEGTIIPCTPMGCMHLIKKTGVKIQVKMMTVVL